MPDNQDPLNPTPPGAPQTDDSAFPVVTDLPPLSDSSPIENQPGLNTAQGAGAPPIIPPVVVSPSPKRKLPPGKIIAGILGILLLVGGVGAGILLVRQQQLIDQQASTLTCTNQGGVCRTQGGGCQSGETQSGNCDSVQPGITPICCVNANPSCSGNCLPGGVGASCGALGQSPGTGTCANGGLCCTTQQTCSGNCLPGGVGQSCGALGQVPGTGTCSNSQSICCAAATNPPPSGSGGCGAEGPRCNDGWAYWCYNDSRGLDRGDHACSCSNPPDINAACWNTAPGGAPPPGSTSNCRYTNDGTTVRAVDCEGYTFRALVFTCNGHLENGRCDDTIVQDTANATSVSIGSAPSCGSKQADLIVTSRPNDGLCPASDPECDELPGTPRVANFITRDSANACGTGTVPPPPSGGGAATAVCGGVQAYALSDTNFATPLTNAQLSALRVGDKIKLALRGTRTGSGRFTQAEFRVNNVHLPITTNEGPGSESSTSVNQLFWLEYTIPASSRSFNIAGSLTHSTLGAVGR